MLRTPICDLLGIEHPVALGGMGSATNPELVAAVSNAGGLGALGCHGQTPEQIGERAQTIRRQTNKPFGLNFLLFHTRDDSFAAALELRRMQMLTEVGAEQNTMTIIMMPSEFVTMAKAIGAMNKPSS